MPTLIATGQKTIIDLSDGKSLSAYLGSNQPRTQVYDLNSSTYSPSWSTSPYLVITPVIYADQTAIALNSTALAITWKRKEGASAETNLATGESVSGNILTVNVNKLTTSSPSLSYIAYIAYTDPDTGLVINATADLNNTLVTNGMDGGSARIITISGEQVFKYSSVGGTPDPASISLSAEVQSVSAYKWQYKSSSNNFVDYPTTSDNASITGSTLVVKPTHPNVFNDDVATIRLVSTDDGNNVVSDIHSIYKVVDGSIGVSSSNAFLTNEAISFAANKSGQITPAITVTSNVVAYTGATKVTPTVGTITGAPSGMTVTKGAASNYEIPITITIADNSTLGDQGQISGSLSVPITSPISTTLILSWNKVNTGATGASSVVFSLYAPNGTVFVNKEGTKTIQCSAYYGSTDILSSSTYKWYNYNSGSWDLISGATSSSYTVNGSDVVGQDSFKCVMTYSGVDYSDVITLIDKTDNYQADIDSTSGDIFKNTVGETCLIARIWQNSGEVDTLKCAYSALSSTAPTSPTTGDFYHKITLTAGGVVTPGMPLMRYNGTTWVDVTSNATYKYNKTYTWYRRDSDGNAMDNGDPFATGKVIYVDGESVDNKTVFVCEVSE